MCQASRQARLNMSTKTPPPSIIKKYPVILNFLYPSWEIPAIHRFYSEQDIEMFLSERKQFLFDPITGDAIRRNEIHRIDPNITYEVAGSGLPYRPKFLKRDQVWDKIFERKTAAALKEALDAEGEKFIELSRVVKDPATGQDVGEWEVILKTSDGTLIFLETKYRMSKVSFQLYLQSLIYINNFRNTSTSNSIAFRRALALWETTRRHANSTWPHIIGPTMTI